MTNCSFVYTVCLSPPYWLLAEK